MHNDSPLMTAQEAADRLRISIYTLRGWTSQGRFPVVKVGRRALYRWEDVELVCREGLDSLTLKTRRQV
jgi:excisionase family DNA binding protein